MKILANEGNEFIFIGIFPVLSMFLLLILGDDRGPVLEVIVSRTNFISSHTEKPVRVVGLSTALANARDLADWLGIKQVRPLKQQSPPLLMYQNQAKPGKALITSPSDALDLSECTKKRKYFF